MRSLGAAEASGWQAAFHVAMNRPAEARALVEAGRRADPASPVVLEADGLAGRARGTRRRRESGLRKGGRTAGRELLLPLPRMPRACRGQSADPETLAKIEALLRRSHRGQQPLRLRLLRARPGHGATREGRRSRRPCTPRREAGARRGLPPRGPRLCPLDPRAAPGGARRGGEGPGPFEHAPGTGERAKAAGVPRPRSRGSRPPRQRVRETPRLSRPTLPRSRRVARGTPPPAAGSPPPTSAPAPRTTLRRVPPWGGSTSRARASLGTSSAPPRST